MTYPPNMRRRDTIAWAREEILSCIDRRFEEMKERQHIEDYTFDDWQELKKQRDRVAKFLGLTQNKL